MYPLLSLSETLSIPTYFLVITIAYILGLLCFYRRTLAANESPKIAMDLALLIMIFGFLGARIFHVIYELPDFYRQYPQEIWKFWQGGFVFYGGFISATVASLIYLRIQRQNPLVWGDLIAPVLAAGYGLGRFGTLLSGSGYGLPTTLPWALIYPPGTEAPHGVPLHPTPIYAMLLSFTLWWVLRTIEKRANKRSSPGLIFAVFLIGHGVSRAIVEQFRDDARGSLVGSLSISTWLSGAMTLIGIYLALRIYLRTKNGLPKPS